jgi:hypothetical protein
MFGPNARILQQQQECDSELLSVFAKVWSERISVCQLILLCAGSILVAKLVFRMCQSTTLFFAAVRCFNQNFT